LQEFSSPKSGSSGTRITATESTFVSATEQPTLLLVTGDAACSAVLSSVVQNVKMALRLGTFDISFLPLRIDLHFGCQYTTVSVKFHLYLIVFTAEQKPLMNTKLSYTEFMYKVVQI